MKQPSHVLTSLQLLHRNRLSELFVLERLKRERGIIHQLEIESFARIHGLENKIAWEMKQLKAERA